MAKKSNPYLIKYYFLVLEDSIESLTIGETSKKLKSYSQIYCNSWRELCEELVKLKSKFRKDKFFDYEIYSLCSVKIDDVEKDIIFIDLKRFQDFQDAKYEKESKIWFLKKKIEDHINLKNDYEDWSNYEEQLNEFENDLKVMEEDYKKFVEENKYE